MKKVFIPLLVLMIISISCKNSSTPVDDFFEKLEKSVDSNKIKAFKNAPKDSILFYFNVFEDNFFKVYFDSVQAIRLDSFFDEINIVKHTQTRAFYLCYAFYSKLNGRKFNSEEIINNAYKERLKLKAEWDKKEKIFELELHNIMNYNVSRWLIGDTLSVILPVEFKQGSKSAVYCNNYPASLDYSAFDDSLKINGKLLQKLYLTYSDSSKIDTSEIIFKLKIIKQSYPMYKIFDKNYKTGDTIPLHLSAYGRKIE